MYQDTRPCEACGAEVDLRPHEAPEAAAGVVGPPDGVVGGADETIDDRVCTNPDCPTRT